MRSIVMAGLALAASVATAAQPEATVAKWKGDTKACFLLAFDDGCPSQLQNAIPVLNKYRIPGTFYLFPEGGHFSWQKGKWAKAGESEYVFFGNHTIDHKGVRSPEAFEPSLRKCAEEIKAMTPNEKWPRLLSFAVPGGVPWKIAKEEVKEVLERNNHVERPEYHGPPFFCGKVEEALQLIDTTIAKGGIEHLDFHGVGGDWLAVPTDYLEAVCKKLDASRKDIWTASAEQYAKYAAARNAAKIETIVSSETCIAFQVSIPGLDAGIYDLPLTVVVPAEGWKTAKVTVGKAKPMQVEVTDGKVLVETAAGRVKVERVM